MSKLTTPILFLAAIYILLAAHKPATADFKAYQYIDKYKDIAIAEMHRTGIPASIKLAQGMHESQYGESNLATLANNHFGIKCKTYWTGQTYYHKDDDLDKRGRLIESCFRSYNADLDSYVDHSNFLVHTAHYGSLFLYDKTDYKAWAHGLKASGYATDKKYAPKLIKKIEKYGLNNYDFSPNPFNQNIK
jgi:flagellum-specific peptidoglycan hydrolase FlgJ